jgi:AraC-like DNA-binding protein
MLLAWIEHFQTSAARVSLPGPPCGVPSEAAPGSGAVSTRPLPPGPDSEPDASPGTSATGAGAGDDNPTGANPAGANPATARARTPHGQLRLAGLLHPFPWGPQSPVVHPADLERRLAQPFRIASITSRVPSHEAAHQLSLDWLGPHRVAAWVGTGVEIVAVPGAPPTLLLPQGGTVEWQIEGRFRLLPPGWLLVVCQGGYRLRCGNCSLVAIALEPRRLEVQVLNLAAPLDAGGGWSELVRCPLLCGPSDSPLVGGLVGSMQSLLSLYVRMHSVDPRLVALLQLDQLFERLLATLLVAAASGLEGLNLAEPLSTTVSQADMFAALLARIRAHLAEPIDLGVLESWTQRSRRELQVVFRDRLGCTPMQWLRRERLQQARRRLEHPRPDDTVAAIAAANGYRNAARFSADFRREFDLAPSQLLRQSPKRPRR